MLDKVEFAIDLVWPVVLLLGAVLYFAGKTSFEDITVIYLMYLGYNIGRIKRKK